MIDAIDTATIPTSSHLPSLRRRAAGRPVRLARELSGHTDLWAPHVQFAHDSRFAVRVAATSDDEAWLLTWLPGQSTGLHDHGGSSGALVVLDGELDEATLAPPRRHTPAAMVHRATDVVGGYQAWVAAGLPVRSRLHAVPAQGGPAHGTAGTDGSDGARLVVDRDRRVVLAGGREVELTRREFDLLAHLVEHPHRVLTRRNLLYVVWQTMSSGGGGTRTVDVHVHRLRSKLGEPFARGLVTLRGVGYRWSPVG